MKTQGVSQALVDLLQSQERVTAFDLYTITLGGAAAQEGAPVPGSGQLLYYCTADVPLLINGNTFGTGVLWDRSQITLKAGLEADSLEVNVYASLTDLVNGVPFHQFLRQGGFDNAYLLVQRAYYPAPGGWFVDPWLGPPGWFKRGQVMQQPTGVVWMFSGVVTEVVTGGLSAQIKVDSHLYTLDRKLPRNLYQTQCNHQLYTPGCGLNRATYAATGRAQEGSTIFQLLTDLSGFPNGWFSMGVLQMTSGALAGAVVGVATHAGATLNLIPPLLAPPAPGDAFTVWAGCDKALATCTNKFNNAANFRGFPWIPPPETAE